MDDSGFAIIFLVLVISGIGFVVYDAYCGDSSTKIITPVSVITNGNENVVMDECFNTYVIYQGGVIGDQTSSSKLMYCKEHNIPCEIIIVKHSIIYGTGIKSVKIINETKPKSCNGDE